MECIGEGIFERNPEIHTWRQWFSNKKIKKTLKSQTILDCFTTTRKPYSQSLAQRSKQKGDFFQSSSGVWTVQLEIKSTFYLMDVCKWRGEGLWWCIFVDCVSFPVRWLDFWTLSFSLCLYSRSCYSVKCRSPPPPPRRLLKVTRCYKSGSRMYRLESVMWSIPSLKKIHLSG